MENFVATLTKPTYPCFVAGVQATILGVHLALGMARWSDPVTFMVWVPAGLVALLAGRLFQHNLLQGGGTRLLGGAGRLYFEVVVQLLTECPLTAHRVQGNQQ